jgi:hypothetical protein
MSYQSFRKNVDDELFQISDWSFADAPSERHSRLVTSLFTLVRFRRCVRQPMFISNCLSHIMHGYIYRENNKGREREYKREWEYVVIVRYLPNILPFIKEYVSYGRIEQVLMVHHEKKRKIKNSVTS